MKLDLGWIGRWLFENALRKLIEQAQGRIPVTVTFQLGSIKGRVIVDSF